MLSFPRLLGNGRTAVGTWVKLPTIESVELMAVAGFDFVVLDLEHSPMSMETAATLTAVSAGRGVVPLVRVPDHSPAWIQRSLDAGASGVLVPHVDSDEQARAVAGAARFEPDGSRGVGPTSRAGNWGLTPMLDYLATGHEVAVIAQIESDAGVRSARAIAEGGRVDALFVGPADLSVSLGMPADSAEVVERIHHVVEQCKAASRPCGIAIGADPIRAAALADEGFDFVMLSNDATILGSGAAELVARFRACAP
ncbi:aldolase/citrate lyase family protein [Dactylosporangium sp. NPDC005572]|uniref:HpcH/HpaI aldolase family protein n=1 Tax=Dactylosporangium sp. NPDC005572 TaxID=3156889 RepID=UPI0033B8556B